MKKIINKQKSFAFGKDIYLLGEDKEGIKYWLEAPKWDCGWYWGFGYVETYTNNNNPSSSKDISSHQHISGFLGEQEKYNYEKGCFVKDDFGFVSNLIDSKTFVKTTFNESESWKLTELFKQFYLLRDMADFTHREIPGCHVTTSPVNHGNLKAWNKEINEIMIPKITKEIIKILT